MDTHIVKILIILIFSLLMWNVSQGASLKIDYQGSRSGFTNIKFSDPTNQTALDLDGDLSVDDTRAYTKGNFNTVTAITDGVVNYTEPAIYGAIQGEILDNTAITWSTENLLSSFSLRLQTNSNLSRMFGALFFKPNNSIILDNNSWMGFSTAEDGTNGSINRLENVQLRFLLWTSDNKFYISNSLATNSDNGRVLDSTELQSETWHEHDFLSQDLNFEIGGATKTTNELNSVGIDGAGWYFETTNNTYRTGRQWVEFNTYNVVGDDYVAVPEPDIYSLFLLGGICLLLLYIGRENLKK